jgi:phage tail-like protein
MDYGTIAYAKRDGGGGQIRLREGLVRIGGAPDSDLVLDDPSVGRRHAQLLCDEDGCRVMDLAGSGGTFLNNLRLRAEAPAALRDGDKLRIGPFVLTFRAPDRRTFALHRSAEPPAAALSHGAAGPEPPAGLGGAVAVAEPPSRRNIRRLPGNRPPALQPGQAPALPESSYLRYLPPCYQDSLFLQRFLLIFESVLEPVEQIISQTNRYFDPRTAPEELLPWLASWFDLTLDKKWTVEQHRRLIESAADLYRWRGTRRGLSDYLAIYTGAPPQIYEPGDGRDRSRHLPPHTFLVIVEADDPALVDEALLKQIIAMQKPAHTSCILKIERRAPPEQ